MHLFTSVGPNPHVVTLFLAEKKVTVPTTDVDIMAGENRLEPYLAKNPSGGTPLLELDTGNYISESIAICEYLEEAYPSPALIGETAIDRAVTRMWVRRIDLGYAQPMVHAFRGAEGLALFEKRMRCVPEGAAGMKAMAQDGLAIVDKQLADHEFVCGSRITLADLLLFAFFEFGARVGQPSDPALTHLNGWHARMVARPSLLPA